MAPTRTLVDALAQRDRSLIPLIDEDPEITTWLAQVGSFDRARTSQRFLPFLAAAGLAARPVPEPALLDHLIVDEAQDVRPLEWRILVRHLQNPERLSLFGDMNQRRSDFSPASWSQLALDLEITDDEGVCEVQQLDTAYRTTVEILRFANRLLPRDQRAVTSIRSGEAPKTTRVKGAELMVSVFRAADDLSRQHATGLTAVITMDPRPVSDQFRKAGWARPAMMHAWSREGRTVVVLAPSEARGLEFDGVVLVEPSDFPPNLGRFGELYTSLTRAVHHLTVVHAGPLPKELRTTSA